MPDEPKNYREDTDTEQILASLLADFLERLPEACRARAKRLLAGAEGGKAVRSISRIEIEHKAEVIAPYDGIKCTASIPLRISNLRFSQGINTNLPAGLRLESGPDADCLLFSQEDAGQQQALLAPIRLQTDLIGVTPSGVHATVHIDATLLPRLMLAPVISRIYKPEEENSPDLTTLHDLKIRRVLDDAVKTLPQTIKRDSPDEMEIGSAVSAISFVLSHVGKTLRADYGRRIVRIEKDKNISNVPYINELRPFYARVAEMLKYLSGFVPDGSQYFLPDLFCQLDPDQHESTGEPIQVVFLGGDRERNDVFWCIEPGARKDGEVTKKAKIILI